MSDFTLALDGSTYAGSVAVLRGNAVVAERTLEDTGTPGRGGREERLLPAVAEALDSAGIRPGDLARVVCGSGPGSFTSLRIAASIAKGIAVGAGIPLYAVPSLVLTVAGAAGELEPGLYVSILPAMRGEWFAGDVELGAGTVRQRGDVRLVGPVERAGERDGRTVGPGATRDIKPHARGVALLVDALMAAGPADLSSWEPAYGRPAEAQIRWEAAHGRPLPAGG